MSRKEAAESLGISVKTLKVQLFRIKQKQKRIEGNKNEIKPSLQYPSALLKTNDGAPEESIASQLIRDLESSKGLSLTNLQKKVILMKSEGNGTGAIAESLGVTPGDVQTNIEQAVGEIKRVQFSNDSFPEIGACEYIGGNRTINEVQVLSCLVKGMSVRGTAEKLGKSESSVRSIMHRSGVSVRELDEQRKSGPRFKNNCYVPPNVASLALLWKYKSGMLTPQEKVEAEVILRSEGLIRSVPSIMKNNSQLISMLNSQKRKKVFHVTQETGAKLKKNVPGTKGNLLDYSGASLIHVNPYAKEENERYGTNFIQTYIVDNRFWPTIEAASVSVPALVSKQAPDLHRAEGSVGHGSRVLLRDVSTKETFHVCLGDKRPNEAAEYQALSPKTPLAEALLGRREGDSVNLEVVKGFKVSYEVLKVQNF
jgi:DNA-binding CsgD family transcriptional regulator